MEEYRMIKVISYSSRYLLLDSIALQTADVLLRRFLSSSSTKL